MKMQEAMQIMEDAPKLGGFLVNFEKVAGGMLHSDYFPDVRAGEPPIPDEGEAWKMAAQFAAKTRLQCVNIYVVRADNFRPVSGYRERLIVNR